MLDRTIPFYNTILRCDHYDPADVVLPDGFAIVPYRDGYEKAWAELECAIGDFDSVLEAESYFVSVYLGDRTRTDDILFLLNADQRVIGSCIAWQDPRGDESVSSLHWLVVDEAEQGKGLGRALCLAAMNRFARKQKFPVYIHTQPWSWKAILLYVSVGFRLQKTDSFSHYENQYGSAMETLRRVLPDHCFTLLREASDP